MPARNGRHVFEAKFWHCPKVPGLHVTQDATLSVRHRLNPTGHVNVSSLEKSTQNSRASLKQGPDPCGQYGQFSGVVVRDVVTVVVGVDVCVEVPVVDTEVVIEDVWVVVTVVVGVDDTVDVAVDVTVVVGVVLSHREKSLGHSSESPTNGKQSVDTGF